jgi:hypothetical protein
MMSPAHRTPPATLTPPKDDHSQCLLRQQRFAFWQPWQTSTEKFNNYLILGKKISFRPRQMIMLHQSIFLTKYQYLLLNRTLKI